MKKLTLLLVLAAVVASLGLAWILYRQTQATIVSNRATLRQQEQKLDAATAQNNRLSRELALATATTNRYSGELADLRGTAEALQAQTNALAQKAQRQPTASAAKQPRPSEPRPPEYFTQLHRVAGTRPKDVLLLTQAVLSHAWENQNRLPTSLDDIIAGLPPGAGPFNGTNRVELVYRGSLDDLKGVPGGSVAILRDQRIWTAPSGNQARVYGMSNGSSQIVESDDDFKSWEAAHLVK